MENEKMQVNFAPGAEVIVEEERNKAIDEQLLLIRKLAPDIAIIEQ